MPAMLLQHQECLTNMAAVRVIYACQIRYPTSFQFSGDKQDEFACFQISSSFFFNFRVSEFKNLRLGVNMFHCAIKR